MPSTALRDGQLEHLRASRHPGLAVSASGVQLPVVMAVVSTDGAWATSVPVERPLSCLSGHEALPS